MSFDFLVCMHLLELSVVVPLSLLTYFSRSVLLVMQHNMLWHSNPVQSSETWYKGNFSAVLFFPSTKPRSSDTLSHLNLNE